MESVVAASPGSRVGRLVRAVVPEQLRARLALSLYFGLPEEQREACARRLQVPSMLRSLRNLQQLGFSPGAAVDIGAYHGEWTRTLKRVFPDVNVLMIEAQGRQTPFLSAVCSDFPETVSFRQSLLGPKAETAVPFHETAGDGTGSSVLEEESNVARETLSLPMTTLDQVVAGTVFASSPLLKLDVQGYELEVLRGGYSSLAAAEVVILEVSFWPYNRGAPLLAETLGFMGDSGFVAHDVCSLMRRPQDDVLLQADVVFVSRNSRLRQAIRTFY